MGVNFNLAVKAALETLQRPEWKFSFAFDNDLAGNEAATRFKEEMINELQQALKDQSYKFSSIRRVAIPKPKGGTRLLGIANIKDRVVQTAMKIVIEPIFEADFHDCSYGYRPKRNAKQASIAIRNDLYNRAATVVEIDFESFANALGIPEGFQKDAMKAMFTHYNKYGFNGGNSLVLETILGRKPTSLETFFKDLLKRQQYKSTNI